MTDTYELALQLIEHELERSFRQQSTTETVRVQSSFARLKHLPIVSVESVKARRRDWEHAQILGQMQFTDIPLPDVEVTETGVILPQTMWGGYDEATVTYTYGFGSVPDGVSQAIQIIAEQLEAMGDMVSTYAAQLLVRSEEIETLLAPYR